MPAFTSTFKFAALARPDLFLLCNLCSPAGRGIPDISAQAFHYNIILDNHVLRVGGTSCSVPVHICLLPPFCVVQLTANVQTVAGIISLLNDYLLASGKKPLGWLNPFLYDQGLAGLNDITSGTNPGCNTEGFSALVGWDPVRLARLPSLSFSTLADFGLHRLRV